MLLPCESASIFIGNVCILESFIDDVHCISFVALQKTKDQSISLLDSTNDELIYIIYTVIIYGSLQSSQPCWEKLKNEKGSLSFVPLNRFAPACAVVAGISLKKNPERPS